MYTVNLSQSGAHQLTEVSSMGFLSVVAFAVTVMLASFALEFILGLVSTVFRLARKAHSALTVMVIIGATAAVVAGVAVVTASAS